MPDREPTHPLTHPAPTRSGTDRSPASGPPPSRSGPGRGPQRPPTPGRRQPRTPDVGRPSLPVTVWVRPPADRRPWRVWAGAEIVAALLPAGGRLGHLDLLDDIADLTAAATPGPVGSAGTPEPRPMEIAAATATAARAIYPADRTGHRDLDAPASSSSGAGGATGPAPDTGTGRLDGRGVLPFWMELAAPAPAALSGATPTEWPPRDGVADWDAPGQALGEAVDLLVVDLGPVAVGDWFGLTAARRLRPGGTLAVLTRSHRDQWGLLNPTGMVVASCQHADLLYLQHIVLALHDLRPTPPTITQASPASAGSDTAPHEREIAGRAGDRPEPFDAANASARAGMPAHADLLLFTRPPGATDPAELVGAGPEPDRRRDLVAAGQGGDHRWPPRGTPPTPSPPTPMTKPLAGSGRRRCGPPPSSPRPPNAATATRPSRPRTRRRCCPRSPPTPSPATPRSGGSCSTRCAGSAPPSSKPSTSAAARSASSTKPAGRRSPGPTSPSPHPSRRRSGGWSPATPATSPASFRPTWPGRWI